MFSHKITAVIAVLLLIFICFNATNALFRSWTVESGLDEIDLSQRNYGVAVADVNFDGKFDYIIAGYRGANIILEFNRQLSKLKNIAVAGSPYEELRDVQGNAIGVCACDIDGDGKEEIYFLNTNNAYAGIASYGDKLFKWRDGGYVDLYSDPVNKNIFAKNFAGRSVACLDRYGTGKYGFLISTYAKGKDGHFALIEMDQYHHANDIESGNIVLKNSVSEAGINRSTGGRSLVVGPVLNSEGRLDVFCGNEGNHWLGNKGDNFVFKNMGNGAFMDVARQYNIIDGDESARGVSLSDLDNDGLLDIIVGNWNGPNRIYMQSLKDDGTRKFTDVATPELQQKSPIRTLMVADFDNDKEKEIFINNIDDNFNRAQPNRGYKVTSYGPRNLVGISKISVGDAIETDGYGTGGAYADIDEDGMLEMLLSHGESVPQPLEIYKVREGKDNNWLRVFPRTKYGSPARGATVIVTTKSGENLTQVIDSGSGYLCQMEPVAHFGLRRDTATLLTVRWPDGKILTRQIKLEEQKTVIDVVHSEYIKYQKAHRASNLTLAGTVKINHTEL